MSAHTEDDRDRLEFIETSSALLEAVINSDSTAWKEIKDMRESVTRLREKGWTIEINHTTGDIEARNYQSR